MLAQDVRSHAGAIGVMQVMMPATGKDMKVGDILAAIPNIYAGVSISDLSSISISRTSRWID